MGKLNSRTQFEFASHAWSAGSSRDLDYTLSFDSERDRLIAIEAASRGEIVDRQAANAFGRAAVTVLTQLEQCAVRLCIHARSVEANPARCENWDMHLLEEARHLGALQRYQRSRWGAAEAGCKAIDTWLDQVLAQDVRSRWPVKALEIVERASRGIALMLHAHACDPLLVRLCSFILADEQFHQIGDSPAAAADVHAPEGDILDFIGDAAAISGRADADALMVTFAEYGAEWLSAETLIERGIWLLDDLPRCAERVRRLGTLAAQNALDYLASLREDTEAMPPAGLAMEWLIAGLRGRGSELQPRRRWLPLEAGAK